MVLCVISGCLSKSGRDKDIRFFRVPKVVTNKGTEHEELTSKRRIEWIERPFTRSSLPFQSFAAHCV